MYYSTLWQNFVFEVFGFWVQPLSERDPESRQAADYSRQVQSNKVWLSASKCLVILNAWNTLW